MDDDRCPFDKSDMDPDDEVLDTLFENHPLDDLHDVLGRYVAFPNPEAHDAMTAWIAASHGQRAWEHAPRAAVVSPEKRCGKSRLMDIAEATCRKPLITTNCSPAALVRSITEDNPPTVLIDEADSIFGKGRVADSGEDLRGIINAGHQRNRPYVRWDMTTRSREDCATFAMAMLASIHDLPDTIMDRAVVVRMRRRGPDEKISPYRTRRDGPRLNQIRDRLTEWVDAHVSDLQKAEPHMPVEDRAADTWEPLVAIADLAGGTWPSRIRHACIALVAEADAALVDGSDGQKIIADVAVVFRETNKQFMSSHDLVDRLCAMDDSPWADKGLTMHRLARRLQPYGVRPRQDQTGSARGYHISDLEPVFSHYIPPQTVKPSDSAPEQGKRADGSNATDTPDRQGDSDRQRETAGQTPFLTV